MKGTLMTVREWCLAAAVILLAVLFVVLGGCTARLTYRHEWTDPNGLPQQVTITYTDGVGNNEKKAVEIILGDGASATLGQVTTNQDEVMKVLAQYGLTLEKLAEAYMNGPLSGVLQGN